MRVEVGSAHPVDDDPDPVEVHDQVTVEGAFVEVQLVDQAGAATGLHSHPKAKVVAALLIEQALDLDGGNIGEQNTVSRFLDGGFLGDSMRETGLGVVLNTHLGASFK